ncbi:MAG: hypothetical protein IJ011_07840 [Clostridia bacterium]|nr:hypothetical protein [Clostridia bacterium]
MEHNAKKNKKHRRRTSEDGEVGFDTVAKNSLIGLGASCALMLILTVALSALCMLSPDPAALTLPLGIAAFCLSAAFGGFISSRQLSRDKTAAVVSGLICGFALAILTGILSVAQSALLPEATHGLGLLQSIVIRASALPLSALFASLSLKKKVRAHRRRR